MKDIDNMTIEQIIRLPFFHALEKEMPTGKGLSISKWWKITLRCNKVTSTGHWCLLNEVFDSEYVVRYKLVDFSS